MGDAPAANVDPNGMQYFTTRSAGGEINEIAASSAWMDGNMRDAGKSADFREEFERFAANFGVGGGGGSGGQEVTFKGDDARKFLAMLADGYTATFTNTGYGTCAVNFYKENSNDNSYKGTMNRADNLLYDQNIQGGQKSNNNGITIEAFHQIANDEKESYGVGDGNEGVLIYLGYNNVTPNKYSNFLWIQTISTNSLLITDCDPIFIDSKNIPFYYSEQDQQDKATNKYGFNSLFLDAPNRPLFNNNQNITWTAELSLLGQKLNGSFTTLATLTYGFSFVNGVVNIQNISFINTYSSFHQDVLNCLP